jgi:predicted O-methyltransferase YrrM
MWIHNLCRQLKPKKTVEIGLAYGFSTIYILAALHENGTGSHTAIDPHQPAYHEIGLRHPEKLNMADAFTLIRQMSVPALVDLHRKDEHFEFIFIDGNHRFDDVLVDFILSSEVCAIGGHIILDDMWMPAIQKVAAFARANRKDFIEIQSPIENIAAFQKIAEDTRSWDHYIVF